LDRFQKLEPKFDPTISLSFITRLQLAYEKEFQDKLQEKKDYLFEIYKQKLYYKRLVHKQDTQQLQDCLDEFVVLNQITSTCFFFTIISIDMSSTLFTKLSLLSKAVSQASSILFVKTISTKQSLLSKVIL